ncbi:FAD-dependent oxidoreductase [Amycolatopsis sp. GM8]|uniref:NAD(P)/FAD-dependent oxidoreductase n=1 Tax=Amycolatopsis sp. GM8 TaxID=2896530 RepID=UPI001F3F8D0B|nr:FAD-dependent oxidoreductase [Amycolatopsis sp. GM8]
MRTHEHTVIIGASAAGVSAALAMRQADYDGAITMIDADPNLPYERPPLSKSLLGISEFKLKPIIDEQTYADHSLELRLGVRVRALDTTRRRVHLDDGSPPLIADQVLLASGVRARRLNIAGARLEGVLSLRDAADAAILNRQLGGGGPLVIIGAGFIGLELAAQAREHGLDVTVVELAPRPLVHAVGTSIGHLVHDLHAGHGTPFHLGRTVREFAGTGRLESVLLDDGRRLPAAAAVVGIGVAPRDDLAIMSGLRTDRHGIVVDRFGASSNPWIWAAGDVASQPHPALAEPGRIEHWDTAMRHGAAVGASMAGRPAEFTATPYAWSDQFGLTYQLFGRPRPTDTLVLRAGATPERFLAFWLRDERVIATLGLDSPREVAAARRLIERTAVVPADVLADPSANLAQLAKGVPKPA